MTSPKINLKKVDLSFIGPGATARPTSDYSENIFVKRVPYLGRIHFVRDQTGILSLSFIVFYWIYGTFTTYFIVLKPQYYDGEIPGFVINVFLSVSALCLVTLVRSALTNPGRVPLMAENVDADKSSWSDCKVCRRKRPLRAHHCRRCKQCVLRMDHHCPWINNCVGEDNHYMFVLLVFYAFLLSFLAFVFCQLHFWYFPKCVSCDREAIHIKHGILFLYLLTVMAFLMMAAMFGQMVTQHFNLLVDRTTLETIIADGDETDVSARGWLYAYKDLCGGGFPLFWLLPCRTRKSTAVYQYVNSV